MLVCVTCHSSASSPVKEMYKHACKRNKPSSKRKITCRIPYDIFRMPNTPDCTRQNVIGHLMPRDADERREGRRAFMTGTPTRRNRSASPRVGGRGQRNGDGPATPPPLRERQRHQPAHRTPPNQGVGHLNRPRQNTQHGRNNPRTHHPSCPASDWQRWNTSRRTAPEDWLRRLARPLSATNPGRDYDDDDSFYRRYRTTNHYSTTEETIRRNNFTSSQTRDTRTAQTNGQQRNTTARRNGQPTNPAPRRQLSEHFNNVENIANGTGIETSTPRPGRQQTANPGQR